MDRLVPADLVPVVGLVEYEQTIPTICVRLVVDRPVEIECYPCYDCGETHRKDDVRLEPQFFWLN